MPVAQSTDREGFQVPWRIRDALKVVLGSQGLAFLLVFAMGMMWRFTGSSLSDGRGLLDFLLTSPWSEYSYVFQILLTLFLLWIFVLRPYSVRLPGFFVRTPTASASQEPVVMSGGFGREVRQASRLVVLGLLVTFAVGTMIVVVLSLMAHPMLHHDPAATVAAYLEGRRRESQLLLRHDMSLIRLGVIVLLAPPFEELVFRGCLYTALRKRMTAWPANLLSSALFAASHCYMFHFTTVLVIGILAAYAYERTRSLRAPIIFHMLWNAVVASSVKPWLWLILAGGGFLLWCRWPTPSSASDRRIGWKIYAVLLPLMFVGLYVDDPSTAWEVVCDLPLLIGLALYAWKRPAGPKWCWMTYGIGYPIWDGVVMWASTIPAGLRAPWQQLLAGTEPIETMNELFLEIGGDLVCLGPALLIVWRLATRSSTRLHAPAIPAETIPFHAEPLEALPSTLGRS